MDTQAVMQICKFSHHLNCKFILTSQKAVSMEIAITRLMNWNSWTEQNIWTTGQMITKVKR